MSFCIRANRAGIPSITLKKVRKRPLNSVLREIVQQTEPTVAELKIRLKAMEQALHRSERLAVASRFAGAVMHEVNNPLEALSNLIYLTKKTPNDTHLVIANMDIAETQVTRVSEITRKTLSYYREQAEEKDFDLVDIAESALTMHSARMRRQAVEIRKQIGGPAIARVFGGEILQILSNLILNSLDALPERGAVLCVRVKAFDARVHITISDNGTGIDPLIYANMFQPHRTTKAEGTGLGLWLSNNIVRKHKGSIMCRTSRCPGRNGTTFRLSFPKSLIA